MYGLKKNDDADWGGCALNSTKIQIQMTMEKVAGKCINVLSFT